MNVAIVGQGYILGQTLSGSEIDNCDVVIRVHQEAWDDKITGKKTDIVAFEETFYNEVKNIDAAKWMFVGDNITNESKNRLITKYGYNVKYIGYDKDIETKIRIISRARPTNSCAPTTGVRTLMVALEEFPGATIHLYGFDFYKLEHDHWYKKGKFSDKIHRGDIEEIIVRGMCKTKPIIIHEDIKVVKPEFVPEIKEPAKRGPKPKEKVGNNEQRFYNNKE